VLGALQVRILSPLQTKATPRDSSGGHFRGCRLSGEDGLDGADDLGRAWFGPGPEPVDHRTVGCDQEFLEVPLNVACGAIGIGGLGQLRVERLAVVAVDVPSTSHRWFAFYSILSSRCVKGLELQPMSLTNVAYGHTSQAARNRALEASANARCQSRGWVGTFWAHSASTEVNSGESHTMSFHSSAPVRLRDQHPETGSIPGSSTRRAADQRPFFGSSNVTSFGLYRWPKSWPSTRLCDCWGHLPASL
jgi:hypothetical protein